MDHDKRLAVVAREFARQLGIDAVDIEAPIADYGVESVFLVELLLSCEEVYGKRIDFDAIEVDETTTLASLDRQIAG